MKYRRPRGMMTVVGEVRVERKCYRCGGCGAAAVPFDDWAGMEKGHLTVGARRLVCLAAGSWSFDQSSKHLQEFCGLSISDQTIRRVADEEGWRAAAWLDQSPAAAGKLRRAAGEVEFSSDGVMVNTVEGWKEMRVTSVAKRRAGAGAEPGAWEEMSHRALPAAEARLVTARFADCEKMGEVWKAQAQRLGLGDGRGVSVLCDGAKWIWVQIDQALPRAEQVVDPFHLSGHVHECAGVLHGESTPPAAAWAGEIMSEALRRGPEPILLRLEGESAKWERQEAPAQKALRGLAGYIREHRGRMPYADRLRRGLPIGSGQIEGACKTVVGRRLKLNSARWLAERAEHLAALPALHYSDLWDDSCRAA